MCIITGLLGVAGTTLFTVGSIGVTGAALELGTLALGTAIAGGVIGTVSGVQNAQMQEAQADYMAEQEEQNQRLALQQAEAVNIQANNERNQLRLQMLESRAQGRTSYAAGGVVLGSGSALDYEADIADAYDLDSRNLEYDIASRRWQLQVEAVNSANQASLYRAQAAGYRTAQTTSLLSGTFNTISSAAGAVGGALGMSSDLGLLDKTPQLATKTTKAVKA